ncbi:MAG TPA: serine protease [Cyanobacteria bacterium UBA8156]|nr:serine protease [Cyanobacteria bacterium UBA8156]
MLVAAGAAVAQSLEPQQVCPNLCGQRGLAWTGAWRRQGNSLSCGCQQGARQPAVLPKPSETQGSGNTPSPKPSPNQPVNLSHNPRTSVWLQAHNQYRTAVGVPPLAWSQALAQDAQGWANALAAAGGRQLRHSTASQRPGQGENLWMGTAGFFSAASMVDGWGSEQRFFRVGSFPNVSTSGNWADVGHYTQIIWRNTTQVGCGLATAGGNDILVCRYSPPGNVMGQSVF